MATYDLVIRGADLIDGTGAHARLADLAVAGDRIAEIGRISPSLGYRVIDAAREAAGYGVELLADG